MDAPEAARPARAGVALALACALAGCGGPAPTPQPTLPPGTNVLITLIDAAAAGHIASFGYERNTMPFLEQLAGESVLFADASSAASYTLTSVASLMTGATAELHLVSRPGHVLPEALPLLPEAFADAGFETHGLSTNAHIVADFGFDRGFESFRYAPVPLQDGQPMRVTEPVLEGMLSFLGAERARPYFAYWHLLPPHAPYDPPAPWASTFAGHLQDTSLSRSLWKASGSAKLAGFTPEELGDLVDLYDSTLSYIDSVLARIHAELVRTGELDRTLWIVLSDHGEAFGQHGALQHSTTVFQELVHVPLLMRFPDGRAARVETPVGLIDLYPTLVELFELDVSAPPSGTSLVGLLGGAPLERGPSLFANSNANGAQFSVRRGDFKLVRNDRTETYALYDLATDPLERVDVSERHPDPLRTLRAELDARVALWQARARGVEEVELDPAIEAQLRAIGYVDDLPPR